MIRSCSQLVTLRVTMDEMSVLQELAALLPITTGPAAGASSPITVLETPDARDSGVGRVSHYAEHDAIVAVSRRYCGLAALPESLGRLTSLKQLDLTGNRLTTLPPSVANLTALRRL